MTAPPILSAVDLSFFFELGGDQLLVGASCHQLCGHRHDARARVFVTETIRSSHNTSQYRRCDLFV